MELISLILLWGNVEYEVFNNPSSNNSFLLLYLIIVSKLFDE